ncbi:6-phosphofructokinase [Vulgatibacter incomptus]|uniref:ATP-dependent 6-phosphofructokinase n=1 Tax=Vulgatibacter incomptus TaxID=1391653 RepID=A0A0K1PBA3_9BACT|nr:6-phosphofructokinase [Vulgatibacter incomptus]
MLTGGGDCPGLNAVIRAVVKSAVGRGWEVFGFEDGFFGVVEPIPPIPLGFDEVRGILDRGGTILGTSNKANPFRYPRRNGDSWVEEDRSDEVIERLRRLGFDALICIGGDGTLQIAHGLAKKGLPVVGCPKTIDNDLSDTDVTFGFDTARSTATEAVGRLHTTAESHDRVMLLEVMGRTAGHLALHAAIAGGANAVLIPEIPYEVEPLVRMVRERAKAGQSFSIIVVAEGAAPKGGAPSVAESETATPGRGVVRLGGAGRVAADLLAERITEHEIRVTVLGHLARGGTPTAYDRLLGSRFGCRAVELVEDGVFDHMVALKGSEIEAVPLSHASKTRLVDADGELVRFGRQLGLTFGDEAEGR